MFKKIREQLYAYFKNLVFGSYVRGEQKETSDVDILVEFYELPSLLEFVNLENYLSDLLGIKVDLVLRDDIRKELKPIIMKEAIHV
ncbi:nucleotidyltransferase family protein [Methanotorris formicicus]|uniref:protein adenylyltransferase n=1 Tax=Methanotorris formicicus Mc-S-70 TaxID=647171 RepID=H1L015_9EURY|nr:nucleotidyltransferase family protein [Methanotorris formicicus]EHP85313.1 DNA polymerase beta domain protein region [Methanotorris formicicus Mc-S-70]